MHETYLIFCFIGGGKRKVECLSVEENKRARFITSLLTGKEREKFIEFSTELLGEEGIGYQLAVRKCYVDLFEMIKNVMADKKKKRGGAVVTVSYK